MWREYNEPTQDGAGNVLSFLGQQSRKDHHMQRRRDERLKSLVKSGFGILTTEQ